MKHEELACFLYEDLVYIHQGKPGAERLSRLQGGIRAAASDHREHPGSIPWKNHKHKSEGRTTMLIAEIEKNSTERIRVAVTEYKGHKFIDCRVYFEDGQGEWRPTKKGIALNGETILEVIEALQKARQTLEGE